MNTIVLFQPDIPQNTGNIVRTVYATNSSLVLVKPLGFSLNDRYLKRAGLDYWEDVSIECIDNFDNYVQTHRSFFLSSHAKKPYTEIPFSDGPVSLVFGSETKGLPNYIHEKYTDLFYTIPMQPKARCLNLSNSVSIVLYEALRQQNFSTI